MRLPLLVRGLAALAALAALLVTPTAAWGAEDDFNDTPTAWQWFHGRTSAQVVSLTAAGYRIVDLEVESASPLRFTVALVKNAGAYGKGWWWYHGLDTAGVASVLSQNNARLVDLEPYDVNGQLRYAAVMVHNAGADAKAWWWVVSQNLNDVIGAVNANNARIVDLEEKVVGGSTWYAAVMIKNTGADAKGWYWWIGVSSSFVSSEIASKGLRLADLERRSDGKYDVVLVKNDEGFHWWWYLAQSEAQLGAALAQTGSRLLDVERVPGLGGPLFYAVMINNSNELTTRIGDILREGGTGGVTGLYLKEANGPVLASLQSDFVFEPASTIKTLMHVHAMRQIALGNASLGETLTVWTGIQGNSCPIYTGPISEGMELVLKKMMENSDNNRTMAIRDRFGLANINGTAAALGMSDTQIIHTLGCGGPPPNQLTLEDGAELHEAVVNGYLGAQRQKFYDLMLQGVTSYGGGLLGTIVDQEAQALGLPAAVKAAFLSHVKLATKGGSYGYGQPLDFYWSILTYTSLPFKNGAQIVDREYVSGIFVHDASSAAAAASTMDEASAELLRDEIRAALETWTNTCTTPATNVTYGAGKPGTNGTPTIQALDLPVVGESAAIRLSNGLPGAFATLFLGAQSTSIPFDGGVLLVGNPLVIAIPVPIDALGRLTITGKLPNDPNLCGATLYHQMMFVDPGAAGFYQTAQTNGLARTLGA